MAVSPAQILANTANAQHSTGPRTEAGKSISSLNATRHGLSGKQIVMPGESSEAYDLLRAGLRDSYAPANEAECILVDLVASSAWKLQRAARLESAILVKLTAGAENPDEAFATAFLEQPKVFNRLQRHINQIEKTYFRAMRELDQLQAARRREQQQQETLDDEIMSPQAMEEAIQGRMMFLEQQARIEARNQKERDGAHGFVLSNQDRAQVTPAESSR
jgi:hypothetical protein